MYLKSYTFTEELDISKEHHIRRT